MNRALFCLLVIVCHLNILWAQSSKRSNIWYFGRNAGVDFNTQPPTPLFDGALNIWEGCATICDTAGQIILYTDGISIWNKNHQVIPGATNLGGDNSATQSGIIVPAPGSPDLYYVFSVDDHGYSGGLRYALVDITQNGGLGGLISSNNVLMNQCTEKITAILHCNKHDFWIIAHEYGTNGFVEWLLTDSGISPAPVVTNIGTVHPGTPDGTIGYLKSSPEGSRLALADYDGNFFEILDFNNQTGVISNPVPLTDPQFLHPYGVEFSPNGKRLYLAGAQNIPLLFQVDLDQPDAQSIRNSLQVIATLSHSFYGAIQNGPDGKIYVAIDTSQYLAVINNPNAIGAACNYVQDGLFLGGRLSAVGLPNLIPDFFREKLKIQLEAQYDYCHQSIDLQAITNTAGDSIVYQWYLNHNAIAVAETDSLLADSTGEYQFRALVYYRCQSIPDTFSAIMQVTIPPLPKIEEALPVPATCGMPNGALVVDAAGAGTLQYALNGMAFQANSHFSNLSAGDYFVAIRDSNNCLDTAFVSLPGSQSPQLMAQQVEDATCGLANASVALQATGGSAPFTYATDNGMSQQTGAFSGLGIGNYTFFVTDSLGCRDSLAVFIFDAPPPVILGIQQTSAACGLENGALSVNAEGAGTLQYALNGMAFQSNPDFSSLPAGNYFVAIRDSNNCLDTAFVSLPGSQAPQLIAQQVVNATCGLENGLISIEAIGGTAPYTYTSADSITQSTGQFAGLAPGAYTSYVIDSLGCQDSIETMVGMIPPPEFASIDIQNVSCTGNDGIIRIATNGGAGLVQTSLDQSGFSTNLIFNSLSAGSYRLRLRDATGCSTDTTVILGEPDCNMYIPNAFYPESENGNDVLKVYVPDSFRGILKTFRIYNRWGGLVFEARGEASIQNGWDGRLANEGVYVYYLEWTDSGGSSRFKKGDITLLR